jgi:hypothetical protein
MLQLSASGDRRDHRYLIISRDLPLGRHFVTIHPDATGPEHNREIRRVPKCGKDKQLPYRVGREIIVRNTGRLPCRPEKTKRCRLSLRCATLTCGAARTMDR